MSVVSKLQFTRASRSSNSWLSKQPQLVQSSKLLVASLSCAELGTVQTQLVHVSLFTNQNTFSAQGHAPLSSNVHQPNLTSKWFERGWTQPRLDFIFTFQYFIGKVKVLYKSLNTKLVAFHGMSDNLAVCRCWDWQQVATTTVFTFIFIYSLLSSLKTKKA